MSDLVAYIPVLHRGYLEMFDRAAADRLWIIGPELTADFKPIIKDIRGLDADTMAVLVRSLDVFSEVFVLTSDFATAINVARTPLIMPDEDISRSVASQAFQDCEIEFQSIFLRWDKQRTNAVEAVVPDSTIAAELLSDLLRVAQSEASHSSDWWRQVGAAIVQDNEVILSAHNLHMPSEHNPYVFGDPRGNLSQGVGLELSTAIHAEAKLIATAAAYGLPLHGSQIVVTTFPCPPCAKLIATAGITRCYYLDGYGVLDGESIMRSYGVELTHIET